MSRLAAYLVNEEIKKYSPGQLRDSRGRFAGGGQAASAAALKTGSASAHIKAMQAHVKTALSHAVAASKQYKIGATLRGLAGAAAIFGAIHGFKSPRGYVGEEPPGGRNPFGGFGGGFRYRTPKTPKTRPPSTATALPLPTYLLTAPTSSGGSATSSSPYRPR